MCNHVSFAALAAANVHLALADYAAIRNQYAVNIEAFLQDYLFSPNRPITKFRNDFKIAITRAFVPAFEQGLKDGGGGSLEAGDDLDWINSKVEGEFAFVDQLFVQMRDLKKQAAEDGLGVLNGVAANRAEGYARTLDAVYSQGKLRGAGNKMLTFGGEDGFENCPTCRKLKGQRHKASWWKNKDLIPYRGNVNLECGGWECKHFLFDDDGNIFSI